MLFEREIDWVILLVNSVLQWKTLLNLKCIKGSFKVSLLYPPLNILWLTLPENHISLMLCIFCHQNPLFGMMLHYIYKKNMVPWKGNGSSENWGESRESQRLVKVVVIHSCSRSGNKYQKHRCLIQDVWNCRNLIPTGSAIQCSDWFWFLLHLQAYWDKKESLRTAADWFSRVSTNLIYKLSPMKHSLVAVTEGMRVPVGCLIIFSIFTILVWLGSSYS